MELLSKQEYEGTVVSAQADVAALQTAIVCTIKPDLAALEGMGRQRLVVKFFDTNGPESKFCGSLDVIFRVVGGEIEKFETDHVRDEKGEFVRDRASNKIAFQAWRPFKDKTGAPRTEFSFVSTNGLEPIAKLGTRDSVREYDQDGGPRLAQFALYPKCWAEVEHESKVPYSLDVVFDDRRLRADQGLPDTLRET